MTLRFAIAALVGILVSIAASSAYAQADFPGVRALGMGEAQRATATGAEAIMLNPAGMSLQKQYVIEAMYGLRIEDVGSNVHISLADSVSSKVAAGLFYDYINEKPKIGFDWAGGTVPSDTITRSGSVVGLSLSLPLGDYFIIGATAKYLHMSTVAPLPKGTVPSSLSLDSINGVTFDVGLIVKLGQKFNIGVIGYNLWDHGSRESPLSLGGGLAYIPIPNLSINFDAVINFTGYQSYKYDSVTGKVSLDQKTTGRLGPGLEWDIAQKVPVRLGLVWDSGLPATYLTA
ncbi:MAG TPA: hypothetical protein VHB97_05100, partial [Polyangia bacterium]|nr:hypothetical protein [Polyangia bacterium]